MKIKFTKKHINQFKKMGIETIYLFGSQNQGKTSPLSDVDIGVTFFNPGKYKGKTMEPYLELYKIFTDILPKSYLKKRFQMKAHEFDLVFLQFVPISLQFEAIKGKVLYEEDKEERFQYEDHVIRQYCDLEYFYDLSYKRLLERL